VGRVGVEEGVGRGEEEGESVSWGEREAPLRGEGVEECVGKAVGDKVDMLEGGMVAAGLRVREEVARGEAVSVLTGGEGVLGAVVGRGVLETHSDCVPPEERVGRVDGALLALESSLRKGEEENPTVEE
jgi:hypothetical protein